MLLNASARASVDKMIERALKLIICPDFQLAHFHKVEEKTCLGSGEIENPGENYKRLEKTS